MQDIPLAVGRATAITVEAPAAGVRTSGRDATTPRLSSAARCLSRSQLLMPHLGLRMAAACPPEKTCGCRGGYGGQRRCSRGLGWCWHRRPGWRWHRWLGCGWRRGRGSCWRGCCGRRHRCLCSRWRWLGRGWCRCGRRWRGRGCQRRPWLRPGPVARLVHGAKHQRDSDLPCQQEPAQEDPGRPEAGGLEANALPWVHSAVVRWLASTLGSQAPR